MHKKIKLFLSSTFDKEMIQQRDVFRNELRFVLEEELGKYGIYFYLFDFELGIPSHTNPECVIRMCLNAIEACTIFVGIIGKSYGTTIQSFVENIAEREKLKKNILYLRMLLIEM